MDQRLGAVKCPTNSMTDNIATYQQLSMITITPKQALSDENIENHDTSAACDVPKKFICVYLSCEHGFWWDYSARVQNRFGNRYS